MNQWGKNQILNKYSDSIYTKKNSKWIFRFKCFKWNYKITYKKKKQSPLKLCTGEYFLVN